MSRVHFSLLRSISVFNISIWCNQVHERGSRYTHSGACSGIAPTGKQLSHASITIYRVERAKIMEEVYLGDRLGLWRQLGLIRETHRHAAVVGRDLCSQATKTRRPIVTMSRTGLLIVHHECGY